MKLLPSPPLAVGGGDEAAAASLGLLVHSLAAHLSSTGLPPACPPRFQAETILGPAYFFADATGYLLGFNSCYVSKYWTTIIR